jgi:hypothetical protein
LAVSRAEPILDHVRRVGRKFILATTISLRFLDGRRLELGASERDYGC